MRLLPLALLATAVAASFGGVGTSATAANADPMSSTMTAAPDSITVGATSTITAEGLAGLQSASFGMATTAGANYVESGSASYQASVSDGVALATFSANQPGSYILSVGTGETVLATVTVTVTATIAPPVVTTTAQPDPAPTPTAMPEPASAGDGVALWVVWAIISVALVLIVGIAIAWILTARRRGRTS